MSADFCGWCAVGAVWRRPLRALRASCTTRLYKAQPCLCSRGNLLSWLRPGSLRLIGLLDLLVLFPWVIETWTCHIKQWWFDACHRYSALLWHVVHDVLDKAARCSMSKLSVVLLFTLQVCAHLHALCLSLALPRRPRTWLCSCYKPSLSLLLCLAEVCLPGLLWLMTTQGLMNACEGRGRISTWHSQAWVAGANKMKRCAPSWTRVSVMFDLWLLISLF